MRLIDVDAFREDYALAERCEDCRRYGKKDCDYPYYSARDFCGWLDDAPTVSGWVSVKERMPEPEENVIIWTKTGCMKYAQYHEDGSVNPWYVYEDNARAWTNVISHWIPLPEPPEVNDNG